MHGYSGFCLVQSGRDVHEAVRKQLPQSQKQSILKPYFNKG